MLDYPGLAALSAVVREGSFERAARALHVTPSAVSQRIRLLEERVGCALVVRAQPCTPTETGRRLCRHVDQVRLLEQDLRGALPGWTPEGPARVTLPVAVNADSLATWAAPALASFAAGGAALLQVAVDDEDHTTEWLRSGAVLAAITAADRPAPGCNAQPLGVMRYRAAASPDFIRQYFERGVDATALALAPSLVFSSKDKLQSRWARRQCGSDVELPRHTLPSAQAFVTAALAGMGWGLHPLALIASHLEDGTLVELVPGASLDVALQWQYARAASGVLDRLTDAVLSAARSALPES